MTGTGGWALPARLAWREVRSHRLRSAIASGAVFLGVLALVLMNAFARGMEDNQARLFDQMGGARIVALERREAIDARERVAFARSPGLRLSDLHRLREAIPEIQTVLPRGQLPGRRLERAGRRARISGGALSWEEMAWIRLELGPGAIVDSVSWERGEAWVLLGPRVAERLFRPGEDPMGQQVVLSDRRLRVGGILATRTEFDSRSFESWVPFGWTRRLQGQIDPPLAGGNLVVARVEDVPHVVKEARRELVALHRGAEHVDVATNEDRVKDQADMSRATRLVTTSIAVIALLSGAVGILNILLASLAGRIRELGVAKSLGAPPRLIFRQVQFEALGLAVFGGVAGVAAGYLTLLGFSGGVLPWEPRVAAVDLVLAAGLTLGMGFLAGWLPARRASRVDPVEAIRG